MDQVAAALDGRCRVLKLDTDEDPDMAELFRVQGLPTLLFLKPGKDDRPTVAHRFEGAAPEAYVLEVAEHHLFGGPKPRDISGLF